MARSVCSSQVLKNSDARSPRRQANSLYAFTCTYLHPCTIFIADYSTTTDCLQLDNKNRRLDGRIGSRAENIRCLSVRGALVDGSIAYKQSCCAIVARHDLNSARRRDSRTRPGYQAQPISGSLADVGQIVGYQQSCQLLATARQKIDPSVRHRRKVSWILNDGRARYEIGWFVREAIILLPQIRKCETLYKSTLSQVVQTLHSRILDAPVNDGERLSYARKETHWQTFP